MGGQRETVGVVRRAAATEPDLKTIHVEINDGSGEERQELAENEATDDGDAEWPAKFGAYAMANGERQGAEERGHGGHENRTETKQTSFVNGLDRREAFLGFGLDGEIDHEDGVFLDDADEQNNSDQGNEREFRFEKHHGEKSADAGGGQSRKYGDGMDKTFVQDAEDDVNGGKSRDDENKH